MNAIDKKSSIYKRFMTMYVIWGFWYIFFDSSLALRPYYQYLWPTLVVSGLLISGPPITQGCQKVKNNTLLFFLFMFACVCATLFSKNEHESFRYTMKLALAYGFALIITSKDYDKIIINCIIFFCTILLIVSFIQLYFSPIYFSVFLPLVNVESDFLQSGLRQGLAVGLTNGTSQNGLFMSIGFLPCATYALFKKEHKLLFSILAICFFIMTFATGKRSYSIILVIELFVLLLFKFRGSNKFKIILKTGVLVLLLVSLYSVLAEYIPQLSSVVDKFRELEEEGDVTNGRLNIYNITWGVFEQNNYQMLGVNSLVSLIGKEAHNSYLQWIVEFGLFLFWIPIYYMIRITFSYSNKIISLIRMLPDKDVIMVIIPFVFISQVLVSAFVAVPFQWHHVMTLFFIFQLMLLRNISRNYTY